MKLVYQAQNMIEAQLVLDQLAHAGLTARIDGEYLQGGMGMLQAIDLIRVLVDEADYDAAKKVVEQWDEAQRA
ncbi:hypothetical protein TDB9533_01594 [Thalassocella blandensis]|nr:hypothetical protein TDB9533_01594 [Thalassocella blandensis]